MLNNTYFYKILKNLYHKALYVKQIMKDIKVFVRCYIGGELRNKGLVLSPNFRKLKYYKDKHNGKRCFIIGNGPSLTAEDLDLIKDEITYGCNKIHLIYNKTEWRPTYFAVIDREATMKYAEDLFKANSNYFTCDYCKDVLIKKGLYPNDKIIYSYYNWYHNYSGHKRRQKISGNMLKFTYPMLSSVTCFLFEMAVYMGCKEIYFLGIDLTEGDSQVQHFAENYYTENNAFDIVHQHIEDTIKGFEFENYEEFVMDAFIAMKQFGERNDVKIYNATRGGKLNLFQRVNLEDIIIKKNLANSN